MTPAQWRIVCGAIFRNNGVTAFTPDEVAFQGFHTREVLFVYRPALVFTNIVRLALFMQEVEEKVETEIHIRAWYRPPSFDVVDPCFSTEMRTRPHRLARRVPLHALGAAADIWTPKYGPALLARIFHEVAGGDQLGLGVDRSFLHIDIRGTLGLPSPVVFPFDPRRRWL